MRNNIIRILIEWMNHRTHYDQRSSHTTTNSTTTQTDHSSFMGPIGAVVMDINRAHGQTNPLVPSIPAIPLPTATIAQIINDKFQIILK